MINTYEGKDVETIEVDGFEWHITESSIRPASFRWEASRRDGTRSVFSKDREGLDEAIREELDWEQG